MDCTDEVIYEKQTAHIAELEAQLTEAQAKLAAAEGVKETLVEHFRNCEDCWDCLLESDPDMADDINPPNAAREKADG